VLLVVAGPDALALCDLQVLRARGFGVVHAASDDEGRRAAEVQWPDLLLWSPTPDASGHAQLPAWLRSVDPAIGLILLAGEMSARAVANALRIGFDDCLIVPAGSRELIRTIDDVLRLVLARRGRQGAPPGPAPPLAPEDAGALAPLSAERLCAAIADELHNLSSGLQIRLTRLAARPDAVLDAVGLLSGTSARLTLLQGRLRCLSAPGGKGTAGANVPVALREAIALAHAASSLERIEIETDIVPDPPRPLLDDGALRQILAETIHNALLATANSDEPRVRVSVRAEGEWAQIDIVDTGIGVLPGDAERIFEPLVSSRRASFGAGLGLYCCRRLLDAVGGSIAVGGRPGRGATFTVRTPAVAVNRD